MPEMNTLIVSLIGMGILALFFAVFLFVAYTRLAVKDDPRVDAIADSLPGANCGGCGYPGCRQYAEAIVKKEGKVPVDLCAPGGQDSVERIASIMGVEAMAAVPKVAVVLCGGTPELAEDRATYIGAASCQEEHLVTGGHKACTYGCLGLGDCVDACPFNAMFMAENGLPVVIEEKCTACGKCVDACPRGIMRLVPKTQRILVRCVNHDKGAVARKVCKVSCIACTKCVKAAPEGAIRMDNFLAVIDDPAAVDANAQALIDSCPTACIVDRLGILVKTPEEPEKKEATVEA